MNQNQLQDATDRLRKEGREEGGVIGGIVFWLFVISVIYHYFFK